MINFMKYSNTIKALLKQHHTWLWNISLQSRIKLQTRDFRHSSLSCRIWYGLGRTQQDLLDKNTYLPIIIIKQKNMVKDAVHQL